MVNSENAKKLASLMVLYSVLTGMSKKDVLNKFLPEEDTPSENISSEELIKKSTGIDTIPLHERFQRFEQNYHETKNRQEDLVKIKHTIEFLEIEFTPRELSAMLLEMIIEDNTK